MAQAHQPGEAVFRSILPEEIDWKPFPAFPPSARLAVLVGDTQAGPYLRARQPGSCAREHPGLSSIPLGSIAALMSCPASRRRLF